MTSQRQRQRIGLGYTPGEPGRSALTWLYVNCSRSAGVARASGSCPIALPANVATGTYELRLSAANDFRPLATSNRFTITNAGDD